MAERKPIPPGAPYWHLDLEGRSEQRRRMRLFYGKGRDLTREQEAEIDHWRDSLSAEGREDMRRVMAEPDVLTRRPVPPAQTKRVPRAVRDRADYELLLRTWPELKLPTRGVRYGWVEYPNGFVRRVSDRRFVLERMLAAPRRLRPAREIAQEMDLPVRRVQTIVGKLAKWAEKLPYRQQLEDLPGVVDVTPFAQALPERTCDNCWTSLEGARPNKRFCSRNCRAAWHQGAKVRRARMTGEIAGLLAQVLDTGASPDVLRSVVTAWAAGVSGLDSTGPTNLPVIPACQDVFDSLLRTCGQDPEEAAKILANWSPSKP